MALEEQGSMDGAEGCSSVVGLIAPWVVMYLSWKYASDNSKIDIKSADLFISTVATDMPYWLQFFQALTSSVCTLVVFGPARILAKGDNLLMQLIRCLSQLVFYALALLGVWSDTIKLRMLMQSGMSWWHTTLCIIGIFSNSANISAGMKVLGIYLLFLSRTEWMNVSAGVHFNPLSVISIVQGPVYGAYMWIFLIFFVYAWLSFAILWLALFPVGFLYIWFCGPIAYLMGKFISRFFLPLYLRMFFKECPSEENTEPLLPVDASMPQALSNSTSAHEFASFPPERVPRLHDPQQLRKVLKGSLLFDADPSDAAVQKAYDEERAVFLRTGVPLNGWRQYFAIGLAGQFLAAMVGTVAARLYLHGFSSYWASFWTTITERHVVSYVQGLLASADNASRSVRQWVEILKSFVQ